MNAPATFRQLLQQTTDSAERPRALAKGHYIGTIKGHEFGHSRQKQTPQVVFLITPEEATSDVEAGANDGIDLAQREMRKTLYITPKALYRITDFLDAVLGMEKGRTYDERIPETRGVRVMFGVTQRDNEDGTETYNDIGNVVKA